MAKIDNETVARWTEMADACLLTLAKPITRQEIVLGASAWWVAHECGITREAYAISREIVDAHIQTALETIFPLAVFKDKKRY